MEYFLFFQFSGNVSEISVEIADLNDFLSAIRQLLLTAAKIEFINTSNFENYLEYADCYLF